MTRFRTLVVSITANSPGQQHKLTVTVLDAPGNAPNGNGNNGKYTCQMVVSWPVRRGFLGQTSPTAFPDTDIEGVALLQRIGETWAEPFRSLARSVRPDTEVKCLELYDWPPPRGLRTAGRVALVGDALHPMAMCKLHSLDSFTS